MAVTGDEVLALLIEVELEEFFAAIRDKLQVTRLVHFNHVEAEDLAEIGMGKPAIRRLLKAAKHVATTPTSSKLGNFVKLFKSPPSSDSGGETKTFSKNSANNNNEACLISANDLSLCETLNWGNFGVVKKAIWRKSVGGAGKAKKAVNNEYVAVKILRGDLSADKQLLSDLISEVAVMHKLDHPNLIKLHGVCFDTDNNMLVIELAPLGSLLEYLRGHKNGVVVTRLLSFAIQLTNALAYLESKNFLHRDIALRNVLLANEETIKLGDFGLARILPNREDQYVTNPQRKIPFAWSAPESLKYGEFTHASDTWMFGVAVWEMFSFGDEPWESQRANIVLELIEKRRRLPKPICCPMAIYQMLLQCWRTDPDNRPTFAASSRYLSNGYFLEVKSKSDFEETSDNSKIKLQRGDKIFVIDGCNEKRWWFGQNKRTLQFGYFLRSEVDMSRDLCKDDISRPIAGTFVHNTHGATADAGAASGQPLSLESRPDLIDLTKNRSSSSDRYVTDSPTEPGGVLITPTSLETRKKLTSPHTSERKAASPAVPTPVPSAPPLLKPPAPSRQHMPDYANSRQIVTISRNLYCDCEQEKAPPKKENSSPNLLDVVSPQRDERDRRKSVDTMPTFEAPPLIVTSSAESSGFDESVGSEQMAMSTPPSVDVKPVKPSPVNNFLQELNSTIGNRASRLIGRSLGQIGYSKIDDDLPTAATSPLHSTKNAQPKPALKEVSDNKSPSPSSTAQNPGAKLDFLSQLEQKLALRRLT